MVCDSGSVVCIDHVSYPVNVVLFRSLSTYYSRHSVHSTYTLSLREPTTNHNDQQADNIWYASTGLTDVVV